MRWVLLTMFIFGLPVIALSTEVYERPGKVPIVLTPAPESDQFGLNVDPYYRNGVLVGVSRELIVKLLPEQDLDVLQDNYNLILIRKLASDLFLLATSHRQFTIETVNQLTNKEGVLYAHPDYQRIVESR